MGSFTENLEVILLIRFALVNGHKHANAERIEEAQYVPGPKIYEATYTTSILLRIPNQTSALH